jgi:hypothetical protein
VVGTHWFSEEALGDFLEHMSGGAEERAALACILDSLETGIHVRTDGLVLEIEDDVIRFEDSACHPNLVALWPEHGLTILEGIYEMTGEDAEAVLRPECDKIGVAGGVLEADHIILDFKDQSIGPDVNPRLQ